MSTVGEAVAAPIGARVISVAQAVNEALSYCLDSDPSVFVIGLGVPDPKGVFGTTVGLQERYGQNRVMDMPTAENGMTGIAIGAALSGMRPVLTHQRLDFALLTMEQIVNQAAKWRYMFGGRMGVPLVIRLVIGRGWGQGPQHSQSLQSWFAHIPGLKVVMPTFPQDAKGLLISSIEDPDPVIFVEHRWTYGVRGNVPCGRHTVPLAKANVVRDGDDVTIAAVSYATLEALGAADLLAEVGASAQVIDIRTLRPLDKETVLAGVCKTGRLIAADTGWKTVGFSSELVALAAEEAFPQLKVAPRRVALPEVPLPTSSALSARFYPGAYEIAVAAAEMTGIDPATIRKPKHVVPHDVPDPSFSGPF